MLLIELYIMGNITVLEWMDWLGESRMLMRWKRYLKGEKISFAYAMFSTANELRSLNQLKLATRKPLWYNVYCVYAVYIVLCITENCWRVWTRSFQASYKRCCSAKLSAKWKSNWISLPSLSWTHYAEHSRVCDTTAVCWPRLQLNLVPRHDISLPCWLAWTGTKRQRTVYSIGGTG